MQVLTGILVFIISAYLAGVNALADFITTVLSTTQEAETMVTQASQSPDQETTPKLETNQTVATIPKILIENAAYQKAAVVESIAPEAATSTALEALVNIYCEHRAEDTIKVTTGTGFFIDTTGIIITNAHVAHFLLLDDIVGETKCVIRAGDPAIAKYEADLLYISPVWVRENAGLFKSKNPVGTGERDYALLYVTNGVNGEPSPNLFPALPFATNLNPRKVIDQPVYAAGYPAKRLLETGGRTPLLPILATTTVAEIMTFGENQADVFTIKGSSVGEQGASGGPILTREGDVIGMISTKGDADEFGEGALRAITLSYIDRTIKEETGFSLRQNLAGDIVRRANIFNQTMTPFLKLLLDQAL